MAIEGLKKSDVGRKVVYSKGKKWEETGQIRSWNKRVIFVRFDGRNNSQAVNPRDLEFIYDR